MFSGLLNTELEETLLYFLKMNINFTFGFSFPQLLHVIIYRQKRVRFPKGKKVKPGDEVVDLSSQAEDVKSELTNAQLASKERALRRNQIPLSEEGTDMLHDISVAEVRYEVCLLFPLCIYGLP